MRTLGQAPSIQKPATCSRPIVVIYVFLYFMKCIHVITDLSRLVNEDMSEMILRELGADQSSGSHQGGHDHPAEGGVARTGGRFLPVVH